LHKAIAGRNERLVEFLINIKADVNFGVNSPLHFAALGESKNIMKVSFLKVKEKLVTFF
jgi:ankyrin repeat protein